MWNEPAEAKPRVFVDANVLVKGMRAAWGGSKAVLILGTLGLIGIETSALAQHEAERALARAGIAVGSGSDYAGLVRRLRLVVHPAPPTVDVVAAIPVLLPLARHRADIAVIVAARNARPDWVLSENERHFNPAVAEATGLRIATPQAFLAALVRAASRPNSSVTDPGSGLPPT